MSMETTTEPTESQPTVIPDSGATADAAAGLVLTELAAEKVREFREADNVEPNYALRVKVMGGGCSGFQYDLYFDTKAEGDYEFESHGVQLISDQMSFMYLMGTTIDYVDSLQGPGFKFQNPNSTGSCGCGSSFSV